MSVAPFADPEPIIFNMADIGLKVTSVCCDGGGRRHITSRLCLETSACFSISTLRAQPLPMLWLSQLIA